MLDGALANFYRATLCVSAVFAVGRCPSVTFVCCIQTAKDIVKLLSRSGSPIILVFYSKQRYQIAKVIPSMTALSIRAWKNFAIIVLYIKNSRR